ncbi:MAG TPA: ATP-grasp domain-containing protein [Blastocatellia bacterium]|nr:ATP-grasp domain-containing protein [Blastocatellia bacterium]
MPRVLLLLPTTTYRTKAFIDAALRLGVDVVAASEQPSTLQSKNPAGLITLDFLDSERAARDAAEFAAEHPIDAIIPVDEDTAVAAASIAEQIKLLHNSVESTATAKNKLRMRETLHEAHVRVPRFWSFLLDEDPREVAARVSFPCVVKPVFLSTSRGVMRADNEEEFAAVVKRLERIVSDPKIARRGGPLAREALVEEFIPGFEVAVEGLVTDGSFRALAIFDKPDPLDGPFFEETIYVTPSRLSADVQREIIETTAAAVRAMGLRRGPVHAELRVNDEGAWVIEVAARAIGGLCSRALRFTDGISLEELIIRHALGDDVASIEREAQAAGVMMIPVPRAGVLKEVIGVDDARRVADIEDVIITAHVTQEIAPPPEGASYLGFIFSRAATADRVEAALREAHSRLEFIIEPIKT